MKRNLKYPREWELPDFSVKSFFPKKTKYCLCIPVINEGDRIRKQLIRMKKYASIIDILLLDGGSSDGSTEQKFLIDQGVRALLIKKSPGKQGTQLRMGFAYAICEGYEGIVTIDGNGKDGVEGIPKFIQALENQYDLVDGSRFIQGGEAINTPFFRVIGIRVVLSPLMSFFSGFWHTDVTNGFRAYSKKYLLDKRVRPFREVFKSYELLFYLTVRAKQLGLRIKEIGVSRRYPKGKIPTKIVGFKTNINVLKEAIKVCLGQYNPN